MPKWRVVDIRANAAAEHQLDAYEVKGSWEHWEQEGSTLRIANCTVSDFSVKDAPCQLAGNTRVEKGATGTYEASALPWTLRLHEALACLQMEGPAIAIMDAPPSEHVCEAMTALKRHRHAIAELNGTDKLLVLSGSRQHRLPVLLDNSEDGESCFEIVFSNSPWEEMKQYFHIFVETPAISALDRLQAPLALLIGSYTPPSGPTPIVFQYPADTVVPTSLVQFVTFSDDVSKARISRTKGITALAKSPQEAIATVIVEVNDAANDEPEHEVLTQLRNLLGKDVAKKGAAYFLLREVNAQSKYFSIVASALRLVDASMTKFGRTLMVPPPPLARVQSYNNNSWR